MVKGKATIQLFNAETGEKEQEVIEENLVTKAVENLLNPPLETVIANNAYMPTNLIYNSENLITDAYGGLLLFSNTHDENVDNIYPTKDSGLIGYASDSISAVSSKEGVRNTAESGWINDEEDNHIGYKFVWDFSTSQANGTISSISLTSIGGGSCGAGEKQSSNMIITKKFSGDTISDNPPGNHYIFPYINSFYSMSGLIDEIKSNVRSYSNVLYISPINVNDDKFFVLLHISENLKIYKIWFKSLSKLSPIKQTNDMKHPLGYLSTEEFISIDSLSSFDVYISGNKAYVDDDEIHIFATGSGAKVSHLIYDLSTGNRKSINNMEIEIKNFSSGNIGYLKDKEQYILHKSNILYWISKEGETITQISVDMNDESGTYNYLNSNFMKNHIDNNYYFSFNNILYKIHDNGVYQGITCISLTTSSYKSNFLFVKNDLDKNINIISTNIYITTGGYNTYNSLIYVPLSYYLGTINNLESPVTKTEAQTMKVVYELTESEG